MNIIKYCKTGKEKKLLILLFLFISIGLFHHFIYRNLPGEMFLYLFFGLIAGEILFGNMIKKKFRKKISDIFICIYYNNLVFCSIF